MQAIVLDNYVLEYAAGSRCDLVTVGNDWKQVRTCWDRLGALALHRQPLIGVLCVAAHAHV